MAVGQMGRGEVRGARPLPAAAPARIRPPVVPRGLSRARARQAPCGRWWARAAPTRLLPLLVALEETAVERVGVGEDSRHLLAQRIGVFLSDRVGDQFLDQLEREEGWLVLAKVVSSLFLRLPRQLEATHRSGSGIELARPVLAVEAVPVRAASPAAALSQLPKVALHEVRGAAIAFGFHVTARCGERSDDRRGGAWGGLDLACCPPSWCRTRLGRAKVTPLKMRAEQD